MCRVEVDLNHMHYHMHFLFNFKKRIKFSHLFNHCFINWNIPSKIIIVKTFVRPILEYALPLISILMKRQKLTSNSNKKIQIMESQLHEAHRKILDWIFGRTKPITVLKSLSGFGTRNFRLDVLEASLHYHLQTLAAENPLTGLLRKNALSANPNDILTHCRSSKFIRKFNTLQDVSWKRFLEDEKQLDLRATSSTLEQYISRNSKNHLGIDECIIQEQQNIFISWRCNTCFLHTFCPYCLKPFNRGHINRCFDLSHAFPSLNFNPGKTLPNFTLLDELLNLKKYDAFIDVFNFIKDKMLPP